MAVVEYVDRCWFTSGASGSSDFTDGTAEATYQNLSGAGAVNGAIYNYLAVNGSEWELGEGAYASGGGGSLARTTIVASSTGSKVTFSSAPKVLITLLKRGIDEFARIGKQMFCVPGLSFIPRVTNGAARYTGELATNDVGIGGMEYSASTEQAASLGFRVPKSVDHTATFDGLIGWTTIAGSSGNCIWGVRARWSRNDDAMDGAWGTAVEVTDGFLAAGDYHEIAFGAVTPAGTAAQGAHLQVEVYRKAADGSDTLNGTSLLLDFTMTLTTNARNDA